jgi:tetratricopeptide (TPR) repeat protein
MILPVAIAESLFAQSSMRDEPPLITVHETPAPVPVSNPQQPSEAQKAENAGVKAFQKGDLEAARKDFEKLLQLAPDNLIGLMNLGAVEYRLKLYAAAEKHLKRVVRLQPETAAAWLTLGVLYCDQDKLDAALAALSQAVLLDPKNPRAHNYLGVTVGRKGWYSGAESELQRALELEPDFADAHFNLALFYLQRDPPAIELARRHYARALELGAPPDPLVEKSLEGSKK